MEDGQVGAKEFPKPIDLWLFPMHLIAAIAHIANLIINVPEKLSLLSEDGRESRVNGWVGKRDIVVVTTRTTGIIPLDSRTQHHPIIKQNRLAIEGEG